MRDKRRWRLRVKRIGVLSIVLMVGLTVVAEAPRKAGWVSLFKGWISMAGRKMGMRSGSLKRYDSV